MVKAVCYYRVSTQRQSASGLGLEAQQETVSAYLKQHPYEVVATFTEVESGKRSDRPELSKALAECKRQKAVLMIAKLDRLARNVHFISGMMEAGVEFICCDNASATPLMLHMLAAFAEYEREAISKRTREALAAAKARGVVLGRHGRQLAAMNKQHADERATLFKPTIQKLLTRHKSYAAVARTLNEMNLASPCGGRWFASNVRRICLR